MHLKINTANCLLNHWKKLSHSSYHDSILTEFCNLMRNNDYPLHFIDSIIKKSANNHSNNNSFNQTNITNIKKQFCSIPYIGTASIMLRKYLLKLNPNFSITFSSHNLNSQFFTKLKDPIPDKKCSGLVYKINCRDCEGSYIGETMQRLETRLKQHEYDVKRMKNGNKNIKKTQNNTVLADESSRKKTALVEHARETGHSFDFNNPAILCFENHDKKRLIREVIEINKCKDAVNCKNDVYNLSKLYSPIIRSLSN